MQGSPRYLSPTALGYSPTLLYYKLVERDYIDIKNILNFMKTATRTIPVLLAILCFHLFISCKKENAEKEAEKKQFRVKIINPDIKVSYSLTYVTPKQEYITQSKGNIEAGESKYYDVPENAITVLFSSTNFSPLPKNRNERKEYKINFILTDYSGTIYYDVIQASTPKFELKDGNLFYTPTSDNFMSVNLNKYF